MVRGHTAGRGRVLSSGSHVQLVVLTCAVSLFWARAVCQPSVSCQDCRVSKTDVILASWSLQSSERQTSESHYEGITSHQLEWASLENLQTTDAGEGVEKREPSCTVGGNVN